jgi:transposase
LRLVVLATAANRDDGAHARRLDEIRGDSKYNNRTRDRYLARSGARYAVTVVERPAGATGFVLVPYRWVVERTHARVGKYRRNSKGDERTTASAGAVIPVSMIHRMPHRLAPDASNAQAAFTYPRKSLQKQAQLPG